MSKKHYIRLVTVLSYFLDDLCSMLAADNPRFDRQRFNMALAKALQDKE